MNTSKWFSVVAATAWICLFVWPRMAGPVRAAFQFVSMTDSNHPTGSGMLDDIALQAYNKHPVLSIFVGDLEYDGVTESGIATWKGCMGNLLNITYPVRGNHDNKKSGSLTLWGNLFDIEAVGVGTNYTEMSGYPDAVYSFDYQNSHFVGLDVPGDVNLLTSNMITWLDNDLAVAEKRGLTHAFIYFHGPIYCFGSSHCSCSTRTCLPSTPRIKEIIEVINKHPIVTATFHGHEHMYAYSKIDSTRISYVTTPFYQFVSGTAGGGPDECNANRCDYERSARGFVLITVDNLNISASWYDMNDSTPKNTINFTKTGSMITPPPLTPTPSGVTSPADINRDGKVNSADLKLVISAWLGTGNCSGFNCDLNPDSKINAPDATVVLKNWIP